MQKDGSLMHLAALLGRIGRDSMVKGLNQENLTMSGRL